MEWISDPGRICKSIVCRWIWSSWDFASAVNQTMHNAIRKPRNVEERCVLDATTQRAQRIITRNTLTHIPIAGAPHAVCACVQKSSPSIDCCTINRFATRPTHKIALELRLIRPRCFADGDAVIPFERFAGTRESLGSRVKAICEMCIHQ